MSKRRAKRERADRQTAKSSTSVAASQWLPVVLPTLVGGAIFACIAATVAWLVPSSRPTSQLAAELWVDPGVLNPEPIERGLYLAAMIFFPAFFLAWFVAARRGRAASFSWPRWAGYAGCVAIVLLVLAASTGDDFLGWKLNACLRSKAYLFALLVLVLAAALVGKKEWTAHVRKALGILVPVVFCAGICVAGIFGRSDDYVWNADGHFEVPFFSVVRSYFGDPLIANCGNQYGLYPLFLLPLFRLVGLSVTSYSATMSLLVVAYLVCLWAVCRHAIGNRWVSLGVWASAVSFSLLAVRPVIHEMMVGSVGKFFIDPYFQFAPIRTIFPGLAMLLAVLRLRYRHSAWTWIGHAVLAAGVLWNVETGVVAWFAWLLFLSYRELIAPASPRQRAWMVGRLWLSGAGILAAFVLVFSTIYHAQFHAWPQWHLLLDYQQIFYLTGFAMLPMPLLHPWNVVALIYLLGLAYSLAALFRAQANAGDASLAFFFSVFGIGIFSYYQGRSHAWVFPAITAPAWILFGLFIDRHLPLWRNRTATVLLVALLGSWTLTGVYAGQYFWPEIKKRWKTMQQEVATVSEEISFIRAKTGEARPFVLSYTSSVYYLAAGKAPEFCPSMSEMFLRRDYLRLMDALKTTSDRVFIDGAFVRAIQRDPWLKPLRDFLESSFSGAELSPSRGLLLLARKPQSQ